MNSHHFDHIIKEKVTQHEAVVPPDIWDAIAKEKKKRRFPFFWMIFLVLILGTSVIIWSNKNKRTTESTANIKKPGNTLNPLRKIESIKNNPAEKNAAQLTSDDKIPGQQKQSKAIVTTENSTQENKTMAGTVHPAGSTHATEKKIQIFDKNNINDQQKKYIVKSDATWAHSKINISKEGQPRNVLNDKIVSMLAADKKIPGKEERSASHFTKKTTKGSSKIKIISGEMDSTVNSVTINKEKEFIKNDTQQQLKIAENNSNNASTEIPKEKTLANAATDLTTQPLTTTTNDSLVAIKSTSVINDSAVKNINSGINTAKKKTDFKNKGLRIEAGIFSVFPMEQYTKPQTVKRTQVNSVMRSEFISDSIKTKMEPGAGFTINLVKNLHKKWLAGIGIQYLRFTEIVQLSGTETNTNYTIVKRLVTNTPEPFLKIDTVTTTSKALTTLRGRNIYSNIAIPLFIRYQFVSKKKWAAAFTTGVNVGLLRKYQNNIPGEFETVYANVNKTHTVKNSLGLDVFAGLHFSGVLYKRFEWLVAPSFDYNLIAYNANNLSFNKKIHLAGVSVGVAYRLIK